jgi:hypothetical protein
MSVRDYRFRTDGTETLRSVVDRLSEEVGRPSPLDQIVPLTTVSRGHLTREAFIARLLREQADRIDGGTRTQAA